MINWLERDIHSRITILPLDWESKEVRSKQCHIDSPIKGDYFRKRNTTHERLKQWRIRRWACMLYQHKARFGIRTLKCLPPLGLGLGGEVTVGNVSKERKTQQKVEKFKTACQQRCLHWWDDLQGQLSESCGAIDVHGFGCYRDITACDIKLETHV